ncbi:hypothetical protein F4777DRAFT_264383 [Nemania sp. FL0916]|nr:hypothetical protein F4777DRAFT_264383 [Nemania sp. FL0916]
MMSGFSTAVPGRLPDLATNLDREFGRADADADSSQPLNSIASDPGTDDKSECPPLYTPRRKRRRVSRNSSPAPEFISLLSSDEEDNAPARKLAQPRRPSSHLHNQNHPSGEGIFESGSETSETNLPLLLPLPDAQRMSNAKRLAVLGASGLQIRETPTEGYTGMSAMSDKQTDVSAAQWSAPSPRDVPLPSSPALWVTDQDGPSEDPPQIRIPFQEPQLCAEQAELVEIISSGRNVFYTGSAGCGKSTVLKAFTRRLRDRGLQVDIVAPTGISALNVGGSTTFVYAGWNLNSFRLPLQELRNGAHAKYVRKRLRDTDVLVIDEISSK